MKKSFKLFSLAAMVFLMASAGSIWAKKPAPNIPHAVDNHDCLSCHETGKTVNGKTAKKTPHPKMKKCEACHKPAK